MKAQSRIGILFAIVSLFVCLLYGAMVFIHGKPMRDLFSFNFMLCFAVACVSLISIYLRGGIAKGLQIGVPVVCGIIAISSSSNEVYSGLILFIIAILIAYNYGIYSKDRIIRIIISTLVLYILFASFPAWNRPNMYAAPLAWISIIYGTLFVVWIIFKESIEQLERTESVEKHKCLSIVQDANKTSREAIDVANAAIDALERLEDSIKKGEPHGK